MGTGPVTRATVARTGRWSSLVGAGERGHSKLGIASEVGKNE